MFHTVKKNNMKDKKGGFMSEKQLSIKNGKFINITVDLEQLHQAFVQMCEKARTPGIEDTLQLSYHLCDMTPERQKAQALLYTVFISEFDGRVQSDFPFSLQDEYSDFLKAEQSRDITNDLDRGTK